MNGGNGKGRKVFEIVWIWNKHFWCVCVCVRVSFSQMDRENRQEKAHV